MEKRIKYSSILQSYENLCISNTREQKGTKSWKEEKPKTDRLCSTSGILFYAIVIR